MVESGEVDALVPERVWQELARGLMEAKPSRMLAVLRECGALQRILPELDALWCGASAQDGLSRMLGAIDGAAVRGVDLAVRFACLMHDPQAGTDQPCLDLIAQACQRMRVPNECRDLAIMAAREQRHLIASASADAAVTLFERCDAFRKPQRFGQLLQACNGQSALAWWRAALAAARGVDAGPIALSLASSPQAIPGAIHAARAAAVAALVDPAVG
jgi:tRNA nucleotidyltransferase (CCA-adding enzyme)